MYNFYLDELPQLLQNINFDHVSGDREKCLEVQVRFRLYVKEVDLLFHPDSGDI